MNEKIMAPVAKMKTYGRSTSSTVNNSIDAFNVLLAKNMTKRLIGKNRKKKFAIKPLPPRTKSDIMLIDDSLHVETEDTFDKLLKGNAHNKIKKGSLPHSSNTSKLKVNKSKSIPSITETSSFYSPVITRSRKKIVKLNESSSIQAIASSLSNNSKEMTNPYLYRITEPTVNQIDTSLEVEYVQRKDNSSSYIIIDKLPNHSQEVNNTRPVYNNVFTKTFCEKQFIHCSTPLASIKSQKNVVNHTISPIKNISSLVKESFEEIKKWDQKFPVINISDDEKFEKKSPKPPKDISKEEDFIGFSKEDQSQRCSCHSFQKDEIGPDINKNCRHLRKRKMWKSVDRMKHDSSLISRTNLTVSLDAFSTFESQNTHNYKNHYLETPVNFITKRRKMYSSGENSKEPDPFHCQNDLPQMCDMSENESSKDTINFEEIRLKELVVNLNRLPESNSSSEVERSIQNSLSSFEQFYSKSIDQVTSQYQCDGINTAKCVQETKPLVVNITINQYEPQTDNALLVQDKQLLINLTQNVDIFENFYSENYSSSDSDTVDISGTNSEIKDNSTNSTLNDELAIEDSHGETPYKVIKNISSVIQSNESKENNLENMKCADRSNSKSMGDDTINVRSGSLSDSAKCTANTKDTNMNADESLSDSKVNELSFIIESSILQPDCGDDLLSDIIESSIQESSLIDGDGFKVPVEQKKKIPPKVPLLKAGKSWRRSFSLYKKSSILIGNMEQEKCLLGIIEKRRSSKRKVSIQHDLIRDRRLSIRVVSIDQLHSAEARNTTTILEDYALNTSYVPEQVLEDSLENSFRCLSLSGRRSITQNQLTVPVTAREVVLRRCGQTEPLPFSECYPESVLRNCQKIGEGVYGEVFLFKNPKGGTSVMKIIPIEGDLIVNGERQKKFDEILSEVVIAMELSNLRKNNKNSTSAFSEVQKIQCVQGRYPDKLLDLWELFEETHGSENDYPDVFTDDQLYIVLQLANGGKDLESYIFNNASQAYAMFKQVAFALAVAENKLLFEHRDLHWGNILLSTVEKNKVVDFCLDGQTFSVPTRGVEVAIIDFTLSRIQYDGVVIFNDLALDPDLFTAEGDYQFEIYKLMQKKNRNNWLEFEPYTNLLWLHYTLDKAITALRYKNPQSKMHKDNLMKLKQLFDEVLSYKSVKEFVLNCLL